LYLRMCALCTNYLLHHPGPWCPHQSQLPSILSVPSSLHHPGNSLGHPSIWFYLPQAPHPAPSAEPVLTSLPMPSPLEKGSSRQSKKQGAEPAWCYTPAIPKLRKLRQENCYFEASLGYIWRPCLKKKKKGESGGWGCDSSDRVQDQPGKQGIALP
jgi:hypothetical protein